MKISIIGSGKVGTVLGYLIARSGLSFAGVYSKKRISSLKARHTIVKGRIYASLEELLRESDAVVIAVSDAGILDVVSEIVRIAADRDITLSGKIFLHTSGVYPSTILMPLSCEGAFVASMHPLQTIADVENGIKLIKKAFFCIEGEREAVVLARRIVKSMGARSFTIAPGERDAYHLAASFLSNYVVSLADIAVGLLPASQRSKDEWMRIFIPLMEGTVINLRTRGVAGALTGPVSRGDVVTVRKHVKVLRKLDPDVRRLHRILAQRAIETAVRSKKLDRKSELALRRLIGVKNG